MISSPSLQLPVWGLLLAIGMSLIFLVPIGILKAVSDTSVGLNVITEFVAGYLIPGNPIGNVCWKCYGYMSCAQALDLATDLKLGHYLKIPPKHMFLAQLLGTAIGCVVNLIVVRVVLDPRSGYRDFLDGTKVDPSGQWDGRKVQIFRSASVIWGLIGPSEFFSGQYKVLYWGFLLGLVLPLIPFFIHRIVVKRKGGRAPAATTTTTAWSKVAFPIILHGASAPPQVPTNIIMTGFGLAWFSQSYLRRNHPRFFEKFNYVIAAALDAGSSINALVIFLLSLTILKIKPVPNWAWNPKTDSEYCKVS
ncbi:hypothetical protein IE53DRAFT_374312 [Violaceomyces palustris]|uniref:Uncharacterized protein n=1 Tax=Violaceomyces palustris TaxID=1673888 RepID=A0ACD0NYY9_9BASI|nr:hypothetical protein IE53DRAFT_374312 [Violaceomyces palustris]